MNIDLSQPILTVQNLINDLLALLPQLFLAVIVFACFFYGARVVRRVVRNFARSSKNHESVGIVLGRLAQFVLIALGLFISIVIVVPSVKANSIIQLLGISSLAIGFAFKDILQNFLAGILILLNEPFKLRDQIRVGEFEGVVEDIQTRATFLRTYDGKRIVIPNSLVFTESVIVNTAFEKRRNELIVGVGYGDNLETAETVILAAINSISTVSQDPAADVVITELAGSSVNIRARWWGPAHMNDYLKTQHQVIAAIKNQLTAAGIDLPFPTTQVLFHDQTESTDGNRRTQREGWPAGKGEVPEARNTRQNFP